MIMEGSPKPELIGQICVVLGVNGTNASRLMLITSSGGLESFSPESLQPVQMEPGCRVVLVDVYMEMDPRLVLKCGFASAFDENTGCWTVALEKPIPGMSASVRVPQR